MRSVNNTQTLPKATCGMRDSPLYSLPPELRNNIWKLVFDGLWNDVDIRPFRAALHPRLADPHARLALLLACKRINSEAQGFAWQNAVGAVGNERRRDRSDRASDLEDMAKDAAGLMKPILSRSGPRLASIVELTINNGGVLACVWDGRAASSCHDPGIAHATAALLPYLRNLRTLDITDSMAYRYHRLALLSPPQFLDSKLRDYRAAREQLPELHLRLSCVTKIIVKNPSYRSMVEESFLWLIQGHHLTNVAWGMVWDLDDDVLDSGEVEETD
ncbi:hypothetical protein LTR95_003067 [Oleoguttula sp. CCFEE 5521]